MARKVGQIVGRGRRTWLVRVYNGRDLETTKQESALHPEWRVRGRFFVRVPVKIRGTAPRGPGMPRKFDVMPATSTSRPL